MLNRPFSKRRVLLWAAAGLGATLIVLSTAYLRDMSRACERVRGKSTVIPSPYGHLEFTEGGSGLPALVIHGNGGGYDQGELLAESLLGDEFHWIAPSRFGYLTNGMAVYLSSCRDERITACYGVLLLLLKALATAVDRPDFEVWCLHILGR